MHNITRLCRLQNSESEWNTHPFLYVLFPVGIYRHFFTKIAVSRLLCALLTSFCALSISTKLLYMLTLVSLRFRPAIFISHFGTTFVLFNWRKIAKNVGSSVFWISKNRRIRHVDFLISQLRRWIRCYSVYRVRLGLKFPPSIYIFDIKGEPLDNGVQNLRYNEI